MAFGPLVVSFDERVLRPRPWTVAQADWASELVGDLPAGPLLELCAGVGHIGLALALQTSRRLVQVDASSAACAFARSNSSAAGLEEQVEVRCGPMDEVLRSGERFSLILADPPWVRSAETKNFPLDPLSAIDGGSDGMNVARLCLEVIADHLLDGGAAILQLGSEEQVSAIRSYLDEFSPTGLQVLRTRSPAANGVLVRLGTSSASDDKSEKI